MAKTSLVILTYNRRAELTRTLARALALPERPPVIVVDNASTDGTREAVRSLYPEARLVRAPRNMGAAARNLGALEADTPYVAFSDDDTSWTPGSLALAERLLDDHPRIAALNARVVVMPRGTADPACATMAASPLPREDLPGPSLLGFLAGAVVFRRDAFLACGGYDERFFIGGEEAPLALDLAAAGWRIVYAEAMTVQHEPSAMRDPAARRIHLLRNALWVAWTRRPVRVAWSATWRALGHAEGRRALRGALRELPWALSRRKPLPAHVEAWRRALDSIDCSGRRQNASTMGDTSGLPNAEETPRATSPAVSGRSGLTASGR